MLPVLGLSQNREAEAILFSTFIIMSYINGNVIIEAHIKKIRKELLCDTRLSLMRNNPLFMLRS